MSFSEIHYIHFKEIDSTSSWAKANAERLDPNSLTCITAAKQTAGRGRNEKSWLSPEGENLYTTLFFTLSSNCDFIPNLAQMTTLSLAELLLSLHCPVQIKWPNDLVVEGKKLSGVLVEAFSFQDRIGVCVGIGLNVDIAPAVDQPTAYLNQFLEKPISGKRLLLSVVKGFSQSFQELEEKKFSPMVERYNELLIYKNELVTVTEKEISITGVCRGVDQIGQLILELPSGECLLLANGSLILAN